MKLSDNLKAKLSELINEAKQLKVGDTESNQVFTEDQKYRCRGWIVSALNAIHIVSDGSSSVYFTLANEIAQKDMGYCINEQVGELAEVLIHLLKDIDNGLLSSIYNHAQAVAYDDFLDHADEYYNQNRKSESGVIAGVVFEDTIRKICTKHGIVEKDIKLDSLISALSSQNIFNQMKAKRARSSAHVRTKATHAQWNEFELSDVKATIEFTRELLENYL